MNEMKGVLILFGTIVATLAVIFIVPTLFTPAEKDFDQLHLENYEQPPGENNYIYNGFSFLKLPDPYTNVEFWYTQYEYRGNLYDIPLRFGPREVEGIQKQIIEPTPLANYSTMYITIDPADIEVERRYLALAVSEFSQKLAEVKQYPIVAACTINETFPCSSRPIITCDYEEEVVVYFKDEGEAGITVNKNCITITGEEEELVKAAYRGIYELLGIMK